MLQRESFGIFQSKSLGYVPRYRAMLQSVLTQGKVQGPILTT